MGRSVRQPEAITAAEMPRKGGRHVVAGNRQAVLETRDAAAGGIEVGSGRVLEAAHFVIHSVATTKMPNMMMAVQLVSCLAA